ncbi:DUF3397 domain-containing protein [Neobacillus niacini]|uniref:DUF3397 domain-containing protein n=1 Tax=Neobacillus niacini TaxID=86668 RepID=UPI002859992E|nr:DUF3397 domain-containing protein [Neobacillus niacini]MDR6998009.1 putative lysophospholipase L1 biosynthesis ABC-type transport system permease subunit [Neobacillus niacini]
MITIFSTILSVLFVLPPLGFVAAYIFFRMITKNNRKCVQRALDYTTIFFIIAVHFLIITIWGKSLFWLIIVVMILIAMVFAVVHWKIKGEILFGKVLKGFWRFNFILFFLTYLALTFYGLIHRALTFTFFS